MDEDCATFAEICNKIHEQNTRLIERCAKPDFNPGLELDNTRNNAMYTLTDFFDAVKRFAYGNVPSELADEMVSSTDALIAAIRSRYGDSPPVDTLAIRAGQAFRRSKRLWRIKAPLAAVDLVAWHEMLDAALVEILDALDNLNEALDRTSAQQADPVQPEATPRKRRGRACGCVNAALHKDRNAVVAELRRRKRQGLTWTSALRALRTNSAYSARLRGKTDATWIRYAKTGFSG